MPVLKHAKKKLRQDKKRTKDNLRLKETFKKMIKKAKENPTPEAMSVAYSSIDKAAKKFVIHKNKAARLKSALAKAATEVGEKTEAKKIKKAPAKKKTKAKKKTTSKK